MPPKKAPAKPAKGSKSEESGDKGMHSSKFVIILLLPTQVSPVSSIHFQEN